MANKAAINPSLKAEHLRLVHLFIPATSSSFQVQLYVIQCLLVVTILLALLGIAGRFRNGERRFELLRLRKTRRGILICLQPANIWLLVACAFGGLMLGSTSLSRKVYVYNEIESVPLLNILQFISWTLLSLAVYCYVYGVATSVLLPILDQPCSPIRFSPTTINVLASLLPLLFIASIWTPIVMAQLNLVKACRTFEFLDRQLNVTGTLSSHESQAALINMTVLLERYSQWVQIGVAIWAVWEGTKAIVYAPLAIILVSRIRYQIKLVDDELGSRLTTIFVGSSNVKPDVYCLIIKVRWILAETLLIISITVAIVSLTVWKALTERNTQSFDFYLLRFLAFLYIYIAGSLVLHIVMARRTWSSDGSRRVAAFTLEKP